MKDMFGKLKFAALAALTVGFTLGAAGAKTTSYLTSDITSVEDIEKTTKVVNNITWDNDNKCAVFDGQASYIQIENPFKGVTLNTGFTLKMEAYISNENNSSGKFKRLNGDLAYKNGWQRLFELSDGTTDHMMYINAGSSSHVSFRLECGGESKALQSGSYYDAWHTYELIMGPGGYMTLYIDGTYVSHLLPDQHITDLMAMVDKLNTCYLGTDTFEIVSPANRDGFFFGKMRNVQFMNEPTRPAYDGTGFRYRLLYDACGPTNPAAIMTSTVPATLPSLTEPGHEFLGWFKDPAYTQTAETGVAMTTNLTLYAKWSPAFHRHCICGASGSAAHCVSDHDDADLTWKSWTATDSLPTTAGNYCLENDVTLTATYEPPTGINLCLNGHVVKQSASASVVKVNAAVKFQLTDCSTNSVHNFKVGDNGLWTLTTDTKTVDFEDLTARPAADTVVAVKGGVITGAKGIYCHGIDIKEAGTNNLYRVNVIGNHAEDTTQADSGSGIVAWEKTVLNGEGCLICGNVTGGAGGGIHNRGMLDLRNCKLSFNTCGTYGGGIGNNGASTVEKRNGTGTLTDCEIIGNEAGYGGGVHNGYKTILKGATVIAGNTASTLGGGVSGYGSYGYGNAGQVTIDGRNVSITNNTCTADAVLANFAQETEYTIVLTGDGTLGAARINIGQFKNSGANPPHYITAPGAGSGTAADVAYFTSDHPSHMVVFKDDALQLVSAVKVNPEEVANATYKVYSGDREITPPYSVPSNGTAYVVYTAETGYFFEGGATVVTNALDTSKNPATQSGVPSAPQLPSVTGVTAVQRYPWNGKVDISYVVSNAVAAAKALDMNAAIKVMAIDRSTTPWTTNVADSACLFVGPRATEKLTDAAATSDGAHQIVWDMNAQGFDFVSTNVIFAVSGETKERPLGGVQLWENGPYFAECNVGASKPEEYGYYFWWGDTVGYKRNSANNGWVSSKDGTTAFSFLSGNCPTYGKTVDQLTSGGYIDSMTNLVAKYDAATAYLGAPWRMPTSAEIGAFGKNCTMTVVTTNGVNGRLITGKGNYASKSVFLPNAGYGDNSYLRGPGSYCDYWTSSYFVNQYAVNASNPRYLDFQEKSVFFQVTIGYPYIGYPVRPVRSAYGAFSLCTGESDPVRADLRTGVVRTTAETETLTYSTAWFGGDAVTLAVNGTTLASGLTGSGTYDWTPAIPGMNVLTHTVVTGGVSVVMTSRFENVKLPILAQPTTVANTTAAVYTNGVLSAETVPDSGKWAAWSNETAYVVYTAATGYLFADGSTVKTNALDTAKNPAVNAGGDVPAVPELAYLKVTKESGVTYCNGLGQAFASIGVDGTGTVTVVRDLALAGTGAAWVPDGSDVTFDLNGKKIDWTTSNGDALIYFAEGTDGKLKIKDSATGGRITSYCTSTEVTNSALVVFCAGNGDLTVEGGTFVSSNQVGAATLFFKSGTGDWTFGGGTYRALGGGAGGAHFLYCAGATGTTVVAGGAYDIRATAGAAAGIGANAECFDQITITGGDFDVTTAGTWGGAFSCGNGSLVVRDGDFSVTSSVAGVYCFLAERGGTTILSNGTFRAETTDGYAYAAGAIQSASLTIAGGTYSAKAFKDTAATVVGKEQSEVTLIGSPVINNGATEGTAWNLAVQLFGAKLDLTGYTGANLAAVAVFADDTCGASYVKGDMTKFDSGTIFDGYFSTHPDDVWVHEGRVVIANTNAATKAEYPWTVGLVVKFTPADVANATATVLTNGVPMAAASTYQLLTNAPNAKVVYTANVGYEFSDHATEKTNDVDTATNPATQSGVPSAPGCRRYVIACDAMDGKWADGSAVSNGYAAIDTGYQLPATAPARANYEFAGWYASWTNGAAQIVSGDPLDVYADHTLYAKWNSQPIGPVEPEKVLDGKDTDGGAATIIMGATTNADGSVTVPLDGGLLALPERIGTVDDGKFVKTIARMAYQRDRYDDKVAESQKLRDVRLPSYLTTIGDNAFYQCDRLTNVTFTVTKDYKTNEKTATVVGSRAFAATALERVVFPADTVTRLSANAFADCPNLKELVVYGKLEGIEKGCFARSGNGGEVTVYLSPDYAADVDFVAMLTKDMNTTNVRISKEPLGQVAIKWLGIKFTSWEVEVQFYADIISPWVTVNEKSVALFYTDDPAKGWVGTGKVAYPVAPVTKDANGLYTARFIVPDASAGKEFYRLTIGAERK